MVWLQVISICFAVTAIVQAFPGTTRDYEAETYKESQEKSAGQIAEHQISSTIEFVYQDIEKNLKPQQGTDQEKYMYNQNTIAMDNESKMNDTENNKKSNVIQDLSEELVNTKEQNSITSQNTRENAFPQILKKHDQWLLFPKEQSPIVDQPRYIHDILSIFPFPEDIAVTKEKSTLKEYKVEVSKPTFIQRTSQPPEVAGPMLYPQSTYSREFDLPFFD